MHYRLVDAVRAVLANWEQGLGGEKEELRVFFPGSADEVPYWSPHSSQVSSEVMHELRLALEEVDNDT